MVVTKGKEVKEMRKCWSKSTKLQLCRMNKPNERSNIMTIVNNTVLNTENMLRR